MLILLLAPVAQLDRAVDYGSAGCVFDSRRAHVPPMAEHDYGDVSLVATLMAEIKDRLQRYATCGGIDYWDYK